MSAVTALTAQNTLGVQGVFEVPADFVERQMEAVISDIGVDALKTGMLGNSAIIRVISRMIRRFRITQVVVDPVIASKNGTRLLAPEAERSLKQELLPLARVITPNLAESEMLTQRKVRGMKGMREAAARIHSMGAKNVLIKGGHLPGEPVDLLFDGRRFQEFAGSRLDTPNTHGTGCTLAAAIAVELAKGTAVAAAVEKAKAFVASAIRFSLPLGCGQGPVNPFVHASRQMERYEVLQKLKQAFYRLQEAKVGDLCLEVQSNLGYALPCALETDEVAAFPGRFTRLGKEVLKVADPEFGASQHIARMILTAMAYDPSMRAAMNVRFAEETVRRAKKAGFVVRQFSRGDEPRRAAHLEGSSLSWGVKKVIENSRTFPDIIFDRGGMGKEPMIRVLGHDPAEVVAKVLALKP